MIIDIGDASVDNHFLRVNILTIALSGLDYNVRVIKTDCGHQKLHLVSCSRIYKIKKLWTIWPKTDTIRFSVESFDSFLAFTREMDFC